MAKFIALLRAVNVGGTGKLAMSELKTVCADAGFENVKTYIASGNVVFEASATAAAVKAELAARLLELAGKPIGVFIRTAAEMRAVLRDNPFSKENPSLTYAFFLNGKPPKDVAMHARRQTNEEIRSGTRELYIYYPQGMGQSRLALAAAAEGTARNLKTVAKLVQMTS